MEDDNKEIIDLRVIFRMIAKKKWTILLTMFITAIVSYLYIIQIPRYYESEVVLAPESTEVSAGGAIGSIASSFGLDLGSIQSSDAIYPVLYPNLFESNDFIIRLFDIKIETIEGDISSDYYTYLKKYTKKAPWDPAINAIKKLFKPKSLSRKGGKGNDGKVNPFMLTEEEDVLVESVKNSVKCSVDKKTDVITIKVKDQDPMVCAILADSIRQKLQDFITEYRTSKARADYQYYLKLTENAKVEYEDAVCEYSSYCDTHVNAILQAYISERDNLENEMQLKFNTYTAMNTQLQAVKAKVQESTPVFTTLQNASVPVKPAGPKRMIFSIAMMILSGIISIICIFRKDIAEQIFHKENLNGFSKENNI